VVVTAATDKGTLYEKAFGVRKLGKLAPMTLSGSSRPARDSSDKPGISLCNSPKAT